MNERSDPEISASADQRSSLYLPMVVLFALLLLVAWGVWAMAGPSYHWMEGPAIAIMISFMPLTAITYLHYRLPQKQEEYGLICKTLGAEHNDPEMFSFVLRQDESAMDYVLPVFFVSVFSILGFHILFSNSAVVLFNGAEWVLTPHETYGSPAYRRNIVSIGMAFLGAFIWSIQYIFRRMVTLDLPPGAFFSIGTRMVYSSFLAVIFQSVLPVGVDSDGFGLGSQFIVVSFLIGIFPERALSWIRDSVGQVFARPSASAEQLPLEMIEGISGLHKARLFELGIDNIQNLAHASLMELVLKTPFKPRVLVDWMAQARLCLEFKENTTNIRAAGIRTIMDLQEIFDANDEELLQELATTAKVKLSYIRTVYIANKDEESIRRLRKAYDVLQVA